MQSSLQFKNIFCVRAVLCIDIVNSYLFVMEIIENGLEAAKGDAEGSVLKNALSNRGQMLHCTWGLELEAEWQQASVPF